MAAHSSSSRPHDIADQRLTTGKRPQRERTIHLQTKLYAQRHRARQQNRARPRKLASDTVRQCHEGIPRPFELNLGFADGAEEGFVGALAVGDPGEHAVLVGLEGAGARVDPRRRRIGRVFVGQADEASSRIVGARIEDLWREIRLRLRRRRSRAF